MGYQPLKKFHFTVTGLNTVSGNLTVSSDSLENAERLLKKLNLLDLVKHTPLAEPSFVAPPTFR